MEQIPTLKKCPYCAEEIQVEAMKCKHFGEMLNGIPDKESAKIYYVQMGFSYNWIKSPTREQAIEYARKNYNLNDPVFCDLSQVITDMTSWGWSVSHKDEQNITFSKSESRFSALTCILLLLIFVVPAIIYAIATAAPRTVSVTLPIR